MKWELRREGWGHWNLLSDDGNLCEGVVHVYGVAGSDTKPLFIGSIRGRYPPMREVARHTNPVIVRQAVWDEVKRMLIDDAVDMLSDDDDDGPAQAGPG